MTHELARFRLPIAAALLAIAIIALACNAESREFHPEATQVPERERIVIESMAFPHFFSDLTLDSLVEESVLIVVGTLQDRQLTKTPQDFEISEACGTPSGLNVGKEGCADGLSTVRGTAGFYGSEYTFRIDDVIKSDGYADTTITLFESGGIVDGGEVWYSNIPLYEPGARYLLFLRWHVSDAFIGSATAVDGLYGAYRLEGGAIQAFDLVTDTGRAVMRDLVGLDGTTARLLIGQSVARLATQ